MWESTTFQEIWRAGEKHALLQIGTPKFGEPTAATLARFEAIDTQEEIDDLADRILDVESWDELLK